MTKNHFLKRCALVMAHPDDEVLWASSILTSVDKIIICFRDNLLNPLISDGRKRVISDFPLSNIENLSIPESNVWNSASWILPQERSYGLAVCISKKKYYKNNYLRIVNELRERLKGYSNVVTHNPWGEYGNEEHVKVFRAVEAVQSDLGFQIHVTGYCSNKSAFLMHRNLNKLGCPTPPLPTDHELANRLKALYIANHCWTWPADYSWPETEVFFPWLPSASMVPTHGSVYPVNFIWFNQRHLSLRLIHRIWFFRLMRSSIHKVCRLFSSLRPR